MANQPANFGEATISTKHKEDLRNLIYLQLLLEDNVLCNVISNELFNEIETFITKDKTKNEYQFTLPIINNIRYIQLMRNVELLITEFLTKDYKNKTINEIRDRLQSKAFQAIFYVVDAEASSDYIAEAIYRIESINTTPLFKIIKEDFYDYNAENLMHFDYYDIAVDKEYALKYLDELKNEIRKHNGPEELLEDDDKLRKVISELDDIIHCDYNSFIDEIIERYF